LAKANREDEFFIHQLKLEAIQKGVAGINRRLYAKYGLSDEEEVSMLRFIQ